MEDKAYTNNGYVTTENEKDTEVAAKNGDANVVSDDASETVSEETNARPTWGGGLEFLMSCISMSVGLGNIWRFPFTAYENGGGAFLIPYIVVLFLVGKPMYYMEMIIGQFTSRNNIRMWVVNPAFKGVGAGQLIATASIVSYYVSLMALTLFYFIQSFKAELPWATCQPDWENCFSASGPGNITITPNMTSSSEYYFVNIVLREYDNIDYGIGLPDWRLTLCLLGSWVGVFLVMIRGVKSSGKAAYFLALFPYVVMIILLIRACTLEGAVNGIIFFIKPQWEQLYNPQVWYAAVTQAFFSLSVCIGAIIMFSSYNQFNHNLYRDSMIVTTLDTFTSLLAGFTIFGILGNLAHEMGTDDIGSVVGTGGTGLAFVSYPDAIAKFDWVPQLFAVLFFLMLFVLGLGSAVSLQSAIVTVLADRFQGRRYWQMALVACISGFLIGLVYVTPGGQFILTLVDKFGGTFLILGMAIAEIAGVFWIYGLENFCNDVEFMVGRKVSAYWRICWGIITPVIMIVVFLYAFIFNEPLKYGNKDMPPAAHAAGWTLLAFGLLQLPLWGIFCYFQKGKNLKACFRASEKWGPRETPTKNEWKQYKEEAKKLREMTGHSRFRHIIASLTGSYTTPTREIKEEIPPPTTL